MTEPTQEWVVSLHAGRRDGYPLQAYFGTFPDEAAADAAAAKLRKAMKNQPNLTVQPEPLYPPSAVETWAAATSA